MINWLLKYDATHIVGAIILIFALVFSGILIKKYTNKYESAETFWIQWWLVIAIILGTKFL